MLNDKTVNTKVPICPYCQTRNPLDDLVKRGYSCIACKLEMAHLDYAPNGAIRGVFGWLLAPQTIVGNGRDQYQIQKILGKGGFGATYLVHDLELNSKPYALKEVPETLFDDEETKLLTKLRHPAIPGITERWITDGMVYQVQEFAGSRSLADEQKDSPNRRIPCEKLLPWMSQLCEALIYLHGLNPPVIHRDLKPSNILLNEDGRIMLIDFGIAKENRPEVVTRTLGRAASLSFSPPEQVLNAGTDERSDIYALGATFYMLLTGQNPPSANERLVSRDEELLLPPSEFVPEISRNVENAILRSLELSDKRRQQSVKEFKEELEGVGMEVGSKTLPIKPPNRKKPNKVWPFISFVTGLVALLAGGYFYFSYLALQPEMVKLEGGKFSMGSDVSDKEAQDNEKPPHDVTVKPFKMAKYEVTRGQYAAFVKDTGRVSWVSCYAVKEGKWEDARGVDWRSPGFPQDDNHPVVCVSLADALAYIDWLNRKYGQNYRLPTEAEWEYAARAGTKTTRYWGDNPDKACEFANVADLMLKQQFPGATVHNCPDRYVYTAPVGAFQKNYFELYDMLGNVVEWTCSAYEEKYSGGEEKCLSNNDAISRRAVRGGSWSVYPPFLRSAYRDWVDPSKRFNDIGFRLAQD